MPATSKEAEPISKIFKSEQQAGEFWHTHDTTDYPTVFTDASIHLQLKVDASKIEFDPDVMTRLGKRAKGAGTNADRLLRKELNST